MLLLLLLYVTFRRTHIAIGHRIQGGSPALLLFPYAVGDGDGDGDGDGYMNHTTDITDN